MWPKPQFPAGYVTFTAEILHGELYFFVQYCNCRTKFEFDLNIFFLLTGRAVPTLNSEDTLPGKFNFQYLEVYLSEKKKNKMQERNKLSAKVCIQVTNQMIRLDL